MASKLDVMAALAKLYPLLVNDERAAEIARSNQRAAALKRANEVSAMLERERIPLTDDMRAALVTGQKVLRTQSVEAVERWLARTGVQPVLVLSGPTGSGKSGAAAWALAAAGMPCKWRTARDVQMAFAGYFGDAAADQERLKRCGLLVVDEVGTEPDPERFSAALLVLIEARKQASVFRTILTTNLNAQDFAARYPDERLQSRMAIRGAVWVTVTDADLRRAKP